MDELQHLDPPRSVASQGQETPRCQSREKHSLVRWAVSAEIAKDSNSRMWGIIKTGLCSNGKVKLQLLRLRPLDIWMFFIPRVEMGTHSPGELEDTHTDLPPPRVNILPPPDESPIGRLRGIIKPPNLNHALWLMHLGVLQSPLKRNLGIGSLMVTPNTVIITAQMDRQEAIKGITPLINMIPPVKLMRTTNILNILFRLRIVFNL